MSDAVKTTALAAGQIYRSRPRTRNERVIDAVEGDTVHHHWHSSSTRETTTVRAFHRWIKKYDAIDIAGPLV